jgi:hypothetical protein
MKKFVIAFIIILLVCYDVIFPQSGSSYTRLGLGDLTLSYSGRKIGMGQLGVSVADYDYLSNINPASWYRINKTRVEFGLGYNGAIFSDNQQSKFYSETDFEGFTFGFPVSKSNGIFAALGLLPVTDVSYNIVQSYSALDPQVGDYSINFEGKGGLSKLFIGGTYELPFGVVTGAQFDYYFGSINYLSKIRFNGESGFPVDFTKSYEISGVGGTFGIISPDFSKLLDLNLISDLRLGVSFATNSKLYVDTVITSLAFFSLDTLNYGESKIEMPFRIITGMSLVLNKKYLLSLDYLYQPWSKYSMSGNRSGYLRDAMKVSLGFEYRPEKALGLTFWEEILWRAGISYEQTQYKLNDEGIDHYTIAGGFSVPLSQENFLDVGLQYGIKGTTEYNLIKENTFKLYLGISLGELWFIRFDK